MFKREKSTSLNVRQLTDEQLINFIISIFGCVQVSRNIVMEAHLIRPAHFTGITCTAYQRRELSPVSQGMDMAESMIEQQLRFRCSTGSHNTSLNNFPLKVRPEHPSMGLLQTVPSVTCCTCIQGVLYIFVRLFFFFFCLEFSSHGLRDSPSYSLSS